MFVAPTMSTPPKRTQWREELQNFRRDHGFSKKVLLDCCLVRRVIAWAAPATKGRNAGGSLPSRGIGLVWFWTGQLCRSTSCSSGKSTGINQRKLRRGRCGIDLPPSDPHGTAKYFLRYGAGGLIRSRTRTGIDSWSL